MKDIMGMMKKVQEMQSKMAALQDELETIEVEGASGGGMVKVTLTAKGDVKGVAIDDSLMQAGREGDPRGSDGGRRQPMRAPRPSAPLQERMEAITAGLPMPPGHEAVLSRQASMAWPPSPDPRSSV